jgi:hypothetical protein
VPWSSSSAWRSWSASRGSTVTYVTVCRRVPERFGIQESASTVPRGAVARWCWRPLALALRLNPLGKPENPAGVGNVPECLSAQLAPRRPCGVGGPGNLSDPISRAPFAMRALCGERGTRQPVRLHKSRLRPRTAWRVAGTAPANLAHALDLERRRACAANVTAISGRHLVGGVSHFYTYVGETHASCANSSRTENANTVFTAQRIHQSRKHGLTSTYGANAPT